jgi:hypothetical protein
MIKLKFCTLTFARCLAAGRAATRVSYCLSSPGLRYLRLFCLALTVWLGATGAAIADEPLYEFWPEIDLWWRLSPAWRLSMFVPLSHNIETDYAEGSLILQADYAWGKASQLFKTRLMDEDRAREINSWLIRGGYLSGRSLDDHGQTSGKTRRSSNCTGDSRSRATSSCRIGCAPIFAGWVMTMSSRPGCVTS